jgi:hypothetical protein
MSYSRGKLIDGGDNTEEYIYFLGFIISKAPWEYRTPVHFVKRSSKFMPCCWLPFQQLSTKNGDTLHIGQQHLGIFVVSPANGGCCGPEVGFWEVATFSSRRAFVSRVIVSSAPNLFEEGRRIDDRPGIRARSWWHPSRSNKSSGRDESLQNSMNALQFFYSGRVKVASDSLFEY